MVRFHSNYIAGILEIQQIIKLIRGFGAGGRLGHGDEDSKLFPEKVRINKRGNEIPIFFR